MGLSQAQLQALLARNNITLTGSNNTSLNGTSNFLSRMVHDVDFTLSVPQSIITRPPSTQSSLQTHSTPVYPSPFQLDRLYGTCTFSSAWSISSSYLYITSKHKHLTWTEPMNITLLKEVVKNFHLITLSDQMPELMPDEKLQKLLPIFGNLTKIIVKSGNELC